MERDRTPEQVDRKRKSDKQVLLICNIIRVFIVVILPIGLVTLFTLGIAHGIMSYNNTKSENARLLAQRGRLRTENKQLNKQAQELYSRRGAVRISRENGYVMPGERVIIFNDQEKRQ